MALSSECTGSYAQKVLDNADIVRDAMLRQQWVMSINVHIRTESPGQNQAVVCHQDTHPIRGVVGVEAARRVAAALFSVDTTGYYLDVTSVHAIERIIQFLKQYPFVSYESREHVIRVLASSENGFEVALLVNPGFYTVCYALWHTEFSDEEEAVNGFLNGLSDAVRLKVARRGRVDYRWTVEFRTGDAWISGSAVGIFRYPFWKKKEIRYLQNDYFLASKLGGETGAVS